MARKTGVLRWLDANGLALYEAGMMDQEIAKRAGCARSVVCYWRSKRGLEPVAPAGSEDWRACMKKHLAKREQTMELVSRGLTDKEAAELLGIPVDTFGSRRRKLEGR